MRKNCSEYWEGIVAIAEGGEDERARAHLQICTNCAAKLEHLRAVFAAGDQRFFDAPAAILAQVKNLMPARERKTASLLRSSLAWSGARVIAEDFQVVVGEGETQTRIMYSRSGTGWQVTGRMPSSAWIASKEGTPVETDGEAGFSFFVADLAHSDLSLVGPDAEIYVPSAEELLSSGPPERS